MKKRILFCGEATWLSTGFAKYNREIMSRLHATGKYEMAEMGAYATGTEEQAKKLPWKFYGVLPINAEEKKIYDSNKTNQFGVYKFDAVVADFQPDIIFDARDPWMLQHIESSRFRNRYKTVFCPTVDSAPQRQDWIDNTFKKADVITAYSRFGKRTLEQQGVKVWDVTSPGVDLEVFDIKDRAAIKKDWGFKKGLIIIGTVMRNQKRKLFPELFEAYADLRRRYKDDRQVKKSVLLCHTSWPDVGWNLPELLQRYAVQRHVIFTYKCDHCVKTFFSWFLPCNGQGKGKCIFCGQMAAHMPTTHSGVDEKELADIYNLMDIYVQPAICEGWGLPIVEAKACGVPGLYSNYSAMEDHCENGGGLPIKIQRLYTEAETMALRSLPDKADLTQKLWYLLTNKKKRLKMAQEARKCAVNLHNWDIAADKFGKIFDNMEIFDRSETWDIRPEWKIMTRMSPSPQLSNEHFIAWCYQHILGREPDGKGFSDWMGSLTKGTPRQEVEGFFRSQIESHNRFEEIRWKNSLRRRGYNPDSGIVLKSDKIPGIIL